MDTINPGYYRRLDPEPKDLQMSWNLPAFLFNAMKYIARAGFKDDPVQDLRKAIRFIEFEIERLEMARQNGLEKVKEVNR